MYKDVVLAKMEVLSRERTEETAKIIRDVL